MRRRVILAATATLLSIAVLEGLLRVLDVSVPPAPLYPGEVVAESDASVDPLIGWRLPPDTVLEESKPEYSVSYTSNRQGFRSPRDFSAAGPERRLIFLGDSYTFGSGVEDDETFPALLEARLEDIHAYNLGIGGFGLDQMWMALRHYGLPFRPRAVVLSFIRHDLDRSLSAYRQGHIWRAKPTFKLSGGDLLPLTEDDRPALLRLAFRHSRLVGLWRKTERSLLRRLPIGYRWALNRAIFEAIRDECRTAGVPLLVIHIPVNDRNPAPMFETELAELEIPYLDLTPLLPDGADSLYYPEDRHLTPAGHRFVADAIFRFLIEEGIATGR